MKAGDMAREGASKVCFLFLGWLVFSGQQVWAQNVGIGTNSPTERLHVVGQLNSVALFENASGNSAQLYFKTTAGVAGFVGPYLNEMEVVTLGSRPLHMGTNYQHQLTIVPGGNVGIGTESPSERLVVQNGNLVLNNSPKGIMLDAADRPFITRGFDPFTSGNYNGTGRWGLFMEPHRLTLGIPNIAGKAVEFATYNTNSTRTTLLTIDNQAKVRRPSSGNADLLPVAIGNVNYNGGIWGGSGNFSVEHPSTGQYYITFSGFSYDDHAYAAIVTCAGVSNTTSILYTGQVSSGRLGITIRQPNNSGVDQSFHFVLYKL